MNLKCYHVKGKFLRKLNPKILSFVRKSLNSESNRRLKECVCLYRTLKHGCLTFEISKKPN